ncbi:MAG: hypothetical protein SOZ07_08905 [Prevotella sp.]|nr:hypothetical protein [Prevotella sp.]
METKWIFLVYRTDEWHSISSKELVYIGEDLEDIIFKLIARKEITTEDAEQIRNIRQTQCSGRDYEWEFEKQRINAFTD